MVIPKGSRTQTITELLSEYFGREIGLSNYTFLVPQRYPIVEIKVGYNKYLFGEAPMRTLEATIEGRISLKTAETISREVLHKKFDHRDDVSASTQGILESLKYLKAKDQDHYDTLTLHVKGVVGDLLSVAEKLDKHFTFETLKE